VLDKSLAKPRFTAFIDVIDILVHVMSKISPSDVIGGETPKIFTEFTAGQVVGEKAPLFPFSFPSFPSLFFRKEISELKMGNQ
jgi:hypothetical protein